MRVAVIDRINLENAELAGNTAARHRHVDVNFELGLIVDDQIEAIREVEAESEVQIPGDVQVNGASRFQTESGQSNVEVDASTDVDQGAAKPHVPLQKYLVRRDPDLICIGAKHNVGGTNSTPGIRAVE